MGTGMTRLCAQLLRLGTEGLWRRVQSQGALEFCVPESATMDPGPGSLGKEAHCPREKT